MEISIKNLISIVCQKSYKKMNWSTLGRARLLPYSVLIARQRETLLTLVCSMLFHYFMLVLFIKQQVWGGGGGV